MSKDLVEQISEMELVMAEVAKGLNPTQISRTLNISRARVLDYQEQWKKWVHHVHDIKARSREVVDQMDRHYDMLIKEAWETVGQADAAQELQNKIAALKAAGQFEKDRVQILQAAGLGADDQLAQQLADTERKHELLMAILREVTNKCNHCRIEIKKRLAEITGQPEVIEQVTD